MISKPAAQPHGRKPPFRIYRPEKPVNALGMAVNFLMMRPAFANLKFGEWSRILVGQINRGHYAFVIDEKNQVVGFAGWAFTTRALAELWIAGKRQVTHDESLKGECMLVNAWCTTSSRVNRVLLRELRRAGAAAKAVYFKRHYPDGRARPVRLKATHSSRPA